MYESSAQLALPGHITPELPRINFNSSVMVMLLFKFNDGRLRDGHVAV